MHYANPPTFQRPLPSRLGTCLFYAPILVRLGASTLRSDKTRLVEELRRSNDSVLELFIVNALCFWNNDEILIGLMSKSQSMKGRIWPLIIFLFVAVVYWIWHNSVVDFFRIFCYEKLLLNCFFNLDCDISNKNCNLFKIDSLFDENRNCFKSFIFKNNNFLETHLRESFEMFRKLAIFQRKPYCLLTPS